MRRLFVGNFDFEHALAAPTTPVLPARLQRWLAELAPSWLPLADDGDWLWTPQPIAPEFWASLPPGWPRVRAVTRWQEVDNVVELVPWGWTPALQDVARRRGWRASAPDGDAVRRANSRRWSAQRELDWSVGLPGAALCTSLDEVAAAIRRLQERTHADVPWVLKAEFGMSGRERRLGRGALQEPSAAWARRRLAGPGGLVVLEPWVDRVAEVGVQFDVPPHGPPQLVGAAPMLSDAGGHYRGSWFAGADCATCGAWWETALEVLGRAAGELQAAGYHGPLGFDVMQYRTAAGELRVRPLQDVNGRWTMGRLALGWRRFFPAAERGCWWHGPQAEWDAGAPLRLLPAGAQAWKTSPEFVGAARSHLASGVVIAARCS